MIKKSQFGFIVLGLALACGQASAVPITSQADPALAGSTLVDFESVAAGDYASFSVGGVTINSLGNPLTVCAGCGGGGGSLGDSGNSLNTSNGGQNIELVFDNPVSAFGIIGGAVNTPWTYTAFDSSNSVIETLNLSDPCCAGFFHGIAAGNIKRVTLTQSGGDWVVFDNLRFTQQASSVPEPATLGLLGLGLGGALFPRHRVKA